MAKRQKIELIPALKAQNFKENDVVIPTGYIKEITDVETKFGVNTIVQIETPTKVESVFMNATSNNNLVDAFGDEDKFWIGKAITVNCKKDETFGKLMLVISPIVAQKA